jgi:hypothetical protein
LKLSFFGSIKNFMSVLQYLVTDAGYGDRPFTDRQLGHVLARHNRDISDAGRYGLVNRALKSGALIRVRRGLYVLGTTKGRQGTELPNIHPFALAQALKSGSYVSFETALSYHGWIPEAVFVTASVTPDRKTLHCDTTQWGRFEFIPLPTNPYQFLVGVDRVKVGALAALVAQPLRALMDLVASRKRAWQGMDWIVEGLRIDKGHLLALPSGAFDVLEPVYQFKAARDFLSLMRANVLGEQGNGLA